jgi:hypothetical protein
MKEDRQVRVRYLTGLLASTLLLFGMSALVAPSSNAQGTPDGETPANEGVCDDLMFATTHGLHALCVAFCEAQDCEPDFSLEDPFEQCTPSSPRVLEVYNARKGEGDPEMPCVQQTGCPCWSPEELADLPFPSDDIPLSRPFCRHGDETAPYDAWWYMTPRQRVFLNIWTNGAVANDPSLPLACGLGNDLVEPRVHREFLITPDEYATCTADVIASGRERGLDCWPEP